ncbi:ATP-binding protein [Rhizorhabdus argentea]|uniref:ATP-binding protein n=1 Tax=Rhizorhabdus argentea TaxID=1387174 RepID=UPI0030EEC6F3
MTKNYALATFFVGMIFLLALVWLHTGTVTPPSGPDAIWFNAGLFTLLLGRFVTEYRFTKPNDVFLNCVAVFVGTSTLADPPLATWWESLRWGSALIGVVAVALSWDLGAEARREERVWRSFVYQLVVSLGRADVLFSLVFILALVSYFRFDTVETQIFVVAWGAILLAASLNLPALGRIARRTSTYPDRHILGRPHSFLAPSIVFCRRIGDRKPKLHDLVGFTQSGAGPCHCLGIVIGERSSANETRIVVALVHCAIADSQLNEHSLMVSLSQDEQAAFTPPIDEAERQRLSKVIGTVAKGTNIAQVKFELLGSPDIAAGSVLRVGTHNQPVFYQVFDGVINEEKAVSESSRAFVEGEAEQIGRWDSARGGFETHDWVARERAPVYLVDNEAEVAPYALAATEMQVGTVPKSNYPVVIDVHDGVLYHSAILGVTGSGKSFLTYAFIEDCRVKGIKAVCLDPTGDYQRYLASAVMLTTPAELNAFLASPDHWIAILETATCAKTPIETTFEVAAACINWCKKTRLPEHIIHPVPRILVVLEEAHLLIPEWGFNPQQDLQKVVNRTAQVVLQARKFGLGFLIVSQRTANVTKSVLNQCNTIVSFQAFDETGFDFLKNYMGPFHVRALPNLRPRHGILVGKASRSRRPLMVHFATQNREVQAAPAPNMPLQNDGAEG